jgi:diguanylate cyclase (GGDEF)-like protein/PAS domain S-box-containing protein
MPYRFGAGAITLIYAAFAAVWIVASGTVLYIATPDPVLQDRIEVIKGLAFVVVTSGLLYLLLRARRGIVTVPVSAQLPRQERWQLALVLVILALTVPMIGFAVFTMSVKQVEQDVFGDLHAVAESKTRQLEVWLSERRRDAEALATSSEFIERVNAIRLSDDALAREAVRARLSALLNTFSFDHIVLLDVRSRTLFTAGKPVMTTSTASAALVRDAAAAGKVQMSDLLRDASGHPHLIFTVPLFAKAGRDPVGAVLLYVAPENYLFPSMQTWPMAGRSGETLLVRRDGESVLFLNELRHRKGAALTLRIPLDAVQLPAVAALRDAGTGAITGTDYRGVRVLATWRPVAGTDWHLVAKLDRDEALQPARTTAMWSAAVALLGVSMVFAAVLLLFRQQRRTRQLDLEVQADRLLKHFYELPFIGMAITSPATRRWLKFNDHLCAMFGTTREEMAASSWLDMTHPEDRDRDLTELDRMMQGQSEGYALEKRFIRKDGSVLFASIEVKCVRTPEGAVDYFLATIEDVTARKAAEAKQRVDEARHLRQRNALIAFAGSGVQDEDLSGTLRRIAEIDAKTLGVARVSVWRYDPDRTAIRCVELYELEGDRHTAGMVLSAADHPAYFRALAEQDVITVEDAQRDARTLAFAAGYLQPLGITSMLDAPIHLGGDEVGVLCHEHVGPQRRWTDDEASFAVAAANRVSLALEMSERKQVEAALRSSENQFRTMANTIPQLAWMAHADGFIFWYNRRWHEYTGTTPEQMEGWGWQSVHDPDLLPKIMAQWQEALSTRQPFEMEFPLRGADGQFRVFLTRGQPLKDAQGDVVQWFGTNTDVDELKRMEASLRDAQTRLNSALAAGAIGTWTWDIVNDRLIADEFTARMFLIEADAAANGLPAEVYLQAIHEEDRPGVAEALERAIQNCGQYDIEYRVRQKEGVFRWLQARGRVECDGAGTALNFYGAVMDITGRKHADERLAYMAQHDALTDLPNRLLLTDRLQVALAQSDRSGKRLALIFMDLDRFKNLNDVFGHDLGDRVLREVAARLVGCVRAADTVSRQGGDEFIVVLPEIDTEQDAARIAEKLIAAVAAPFVLDGTELVLSGSIGIACFPENGRDTETLLRNADVAMYVAKDRGRNRYQFYSADMNARAHERLLLEGDLRRAIEREQLFVVYQPQVDFGTGIVVGIEALVRWQHPTHGMMPPGKFIPIAEDSGQIGAIGAWVLETACRQHAGWVAEGLITGTLAVNVSAHQFRQPDFVDTVSAVLARSGLQAGFLELEVTESVVMHGVEDVLHKLNRLDLLGIKLAIDDFGTGYSSLSYLKQFPIYRLKIDQSFTRGLPDDRESAAITQAVISLGHSLGLNVLAEGVETHAQEEYLRSAGCDVGQGYLYAKPFPADECTEYLRLHAQSPNASPEPAGR